MRFISTFPFCGKIYCCSVSSDDISSREACEREEDDLTLADAVDVMPDPAYPPLDNSRGRDDEALDRSVVSARFKAFFSLISWPSVHPLAGGVMSEHLAWTVNSQS